ncbi:MAG: hypothetical protein LQ340_002697 [Diploschistes diacapsis]|nr:MAG: hypothetical protein LQ340_002697 [Diploschistes diacapsis]
MAWFRPSDALAQSEACKSLPPEEQQHLVHSTRPTWEICSYASPLHPAASPDKPLPLIPHHRHASPILGYHLLSIIQPRCAAGLRSKTLLHQLDHRNTREAARIGYKILTSPLIAEDTEVTTGVPESMSDEHIMEYARHFTGTTWHMSCTAKMGGDEDAETVVDTRLRVRRLEGLGAVDLSTTPFILNCHTVAVA